MLETAPVAVHNSEGMSASEAMHSPVAGFSLLGCVHMHRGTGGPGVWEQEEQAAQLTRLQRSRQEQGGASSAARRAMPRDSQAGSSELDETVSRVLTALLSLLCQHWKHAFLFRGAAWGAECSLMQRQGRLTSACVQAQQSQGLVLVHRWAS